MVLINDMKKSDLRQIQNLYQELIPEGISVETLEQQFEKIDNQPEYCLLVAKEDERVLGTAMGIVCQALDTPFLVIENVVVDPSCRKQGLGRKIFNHLEGFAKENHCQYIILVSSGFRKEAHQFYEAMGYVEDVRGFRKYI